MTSTFRIPILLRTMREIVVALLMIKSQAKILGILTKRENKKIPVVYKVGK